MRDNVVSDDVTNVITNDVRITSSLRSDVIILVVNLCCHEMEHFSFTCSDTFAVGWMLCQP